MKSIGLVEDDETLSEILTKNIERKINCKVLNYESPNQALQTFRSTAPPLDLLITDYNFPGINGCEFIKQIQIEKLLQDCQYLLLTGEIHPENPLNLPVLNKPIASKDLIEKIETLLGLPVKPLSI